MVKEVTGKMCLLHQKTGNPKVWVYVPVLLSTDTNFHFKPPCKVKIRFEEGKLIIENVKGGE